MPMKLKAALAASAVAALSATGASATTFNISFTNNASGGDIFFTPIFSALHNGTFDTFDTGSPAKVALERIAEDGAVGDAIALVESAGGVGGAILGVDGASGAFNGGPSGPPLFEPGETSTLTLDSSAVHGGDGVFFSFLSMILPSNDFFIGNGGSREIQLLDAAGNFLGTNGVLEFDVLYNDVYDAGTEVNSIVDANGVLENSPFVVGSAQGPGLGNIGPDENGVVRNVQADPDLSLSSLVGTVTPAGTIEFVPSAAPGNNQLGTFRIEVVAPVPLPAAAPLLLAGIGGMAFMARRKKKQA